MTDKYVKAIKDELKAEIKLGRRYKSFEIQKFTNGLERALAIIEKYERKDQKYERKENEDGSRSSN